MAETGKALDGILRTSDSLEHVRMGSVELQLSSGQQLQPKITGHSPTRPDAAASVRGCGPDRGCCASGEQGTHPVYLFQFKHVTPLDRSACLLKKSRTGAGSWLSCRSLLDAQGNASPLCQVTAKPGEGIEWALAPLLTSERPRIVRQWRTVGYWVVAACASEERARRAIGAVQRFAARRWNWLLSSFVVCYVMNLFGLWFYKHNQQQALAVMWAGTAVMVPQVIVWTACINTDLLRHVAHQFAVWYVGLNSFGLTISLAFCFDDERMAPMLLSIGIVHMVATAYRLSQII